MLNTGRPGQQLVLGWRATTWMGAHLPMFDHYHIAKGKKYLVGEESLKTGAIPSGSSDVSVRDHTATSLWEVGGRT